MASLWSSAWLVDVAIAITLAEWLALAVYHRVTGQGIAPKDFQWNLLSGLCLMLALRCALQEAAWPWGAACLAASGVAHITYLGQRWQKRRKATQAFLV